MRTAEHRAEQTGRARHQHKEISHTVHERGVASRASSRGKAFRLRHGSSDTCWSVDDVARRCISVSCCEPCLPLLERCQEGGPLLLCHWLLLPCQPAHCSSGQETANGGSHVYRIHRIHDWHTVLAAQMSKPSLVPVFAHHSAAFTPITHLQVLLGLEASGQGDVVADLRPVRLQRAQHACTRPPVHCAL